MRKEPLMDFTYQTGSDGMLYPQIQISEDMETSLMPVKKFGGMWKKYMMELHPHRMAELVAQGFLSAFFSEASATPAAGTWQGGRRGECKNFR